MIEYIKQQWRRKFRTLIFIVIGFVIGNLVLSCGISISVQNVTRQRNMTSGNPNIQALIHLESESKMLPRNVISFSKSLSKYGELQIISAEDVTIDATNKEYSLFPLFVSKEEEWHIPLLEGRYFEKKEMSDSKVILGKTIAEEMNLHKDDMVTIEGIQYEIVAICGLEWEETIWDNVVGMTWGSFTKYHADMLHTNKIEVMVKSGKEDLVSNYETDKKIAKELGIEYSYENIMESDEKAEESDNSVIITIIASVLVFTIVIINITNLMLYWVLDRKKDLSVFKAMGASNKYLTKCIVLEVVAMTLLGFVIALLIQYILNQLMGATLRAQDIYMDISCVNVGTCSLVTTVCGILASIIPARIIMKIQPAEGVRG